MALDMFDDSEISWARFHGVRQFLQRYGALLGTSRLLLPHCGALQSRNSPRLRVSLFGPAESFKNSAHLIPSCKKRSVLMSRKSVGKSSGIPGALWLVFISGNAICTKLHTQVAGCFFD